MAGKTVFLNPKIKRFISRLKAKFNPSRIILFGSRARGEEMKYSDWDFLIVSDAFEGISFRDRIDEALKLVDFPVGNDIEPLCYTLKEFNRRKKELGIVRKAAEEGMEIS